MGRNRIYYEYDLPYSAVRVVEAIIEDYPRREAMIKNTQSPDNVKELMRINGAIEECVGLFEPSLCAIVKEDIINRVCYERSRAAYISSRAMYYRRRKKFIHDVANAINLV